MYSDLAVIDFDGSYNQREYRCRMSVRVNRFYPKLSGLTGATCEDIDAISAIVAFIANQSPVGFRS